MVWVEESDGRRWPSRPGGLQFAVVADEDTFELMVDGADGQSVTISIPFREFADRDLPMIRMLVEHELERRYTE